MIHVMKNDHIFSDNVEDASNICRIIVILKLFRYHTHTTDPFVDMQYMIIEASRFDLEMMFIKR